MKPLHFWVGALLAALVLTVFAAAFFAANWRELYVEQLSRRVWPEKARGEEVVEAAKPGPTLLLIGDSRVGQWPLVPAENGRIAKVGFSDATTAFILANAREALGKYRPDIVVIEAGINDVKLAGAEPELRERIVETAATHIGKLVKECTAAGARVILLPVWPFSEPSLLRRPVWNERAVARARDELNARLRKLESPAVVFVDLFAEGGVTPQFCDTLHFTPETYRSLTPVLWKRVAELHAASQP